MPTDSLLLSLSVCLIFLVFAVVLAVIDHRTTSWQREKSAKQTRQTADPVRRKAA